MTATDRPHGRTKYVTEKCRCDICRQAARDYERERSQRIEPAYVSADPARQHLRFLGEHGVGAKTVAARSGVSYGAISKLVYGDPRRGQAPSKRIRKATLDAILAVTPADAADGAKIPAGPTLAAVDRLVAAGVPKVRIAERIGQTGPGLQLGTDYVTARNARAIDELVAELDAGTLVTIKRDRHGGVTTIAPPPAEQDEDAYPKAVTETDLFISSVADVLEARIDQAEWRRSAACRNRPPHIWFPAKGDGVTLRAAKKVCSACVVRDECLEANLDQRDGVFGGLSAKQRRDLRRAREAV